MQKNWIFSLGFLAAVHSCAFAAEKHSAIQDSLILHRIAEYWKEGDVATVKVQITDFLSKHVDHPYADQLHAMLGDIYFQENDFGEALAAYDQILGKEFQEKTQYHRIHCFYKMSRYADMISSAKLFLKRSGIPKDRENAVRLRMAEGYYRLGKQTEHQTAKEALFKEALNQYLVLGPTEYADLTLHPLAEIYTYFKNDERAAEVFLKLADKYPEKEEGCLFQVAALQLSYDRPQAIETYGKIYRLHGPYASQAAFNQMNLLFEGKLYREILLVQGEALKHVSSDQMPLMHYFIGKSLYAVGDYSNAILPLKAFVSSAVTDADQLKSALLSLVACAKETNDLSLFDQVLAHLKKGYPQDAETARAILLHSQLYKEKGNFKRAQEDLKEVAAAFPGHPQREAILYDHAILLSQNKEWSNAVRAFREFLKEYPASLKQGAAWRHLAFCQIEEAKSSSSTTERVKKQELVDVLAQALKQGKIFSQAEEQEVQYLLGKTHYETDNYDEALQCLEEYVDAHGKDFHSAEAHLLMAYSHLKGSQDMLLFASEAEKALALRPGLVEMDSLHLMLYNAYLTLAQKEVPEEKGSLVERAADHLFLVLDQPLKRENLLWLANHYYRQLQGATEKGRDLYFTRTVAVLEKLLGLQGDRFKLTVSTDMEAEAIKLSELYAQSHRFTDQIQLLKTLKGVQEKHPYLEWKYQRLTLFELARSYEQSGEVQKAVQTYDFLINSSSHTSSYFGTAAQLYKARLEFSLLKRGSAGVQGILDSLKDLQIKRRLVSEPLHLEAALSYIEIKASLAPEEEQTQCALELIRQTRTSFNALHEPLVQHYFGAKEQFKDKMEIFQQYMQFFSAEEYRLEGMIALKNHDTLGAKEFKMKALVQLDELMRPSIDPALQTRIRHSREALNRDL